MKNKLVLAVFLTCWLFIACVASIDTALTVKFREGIAHNEQNPIARLILASDGWDVSRFVGLKMFGTILVLGFCTVLYNFRSRHAFSVIGTIAAFQSMLLIYLFLS